MYVHIITSFNISYYKLICANVSLYIPLAWKLICFLLGIPTNDSSSLYDSVQYANNATPISFRWWLILLLAILLPKTYSNGMTYKNKCGYTLKITFKCKYSVLENVMNITYLLAPPDCTEMYNKLWYFCTFTYLYVRKIKRYNANYVTNARKLPDCWGCFDEAKWINKTFFN